MGLMMKTNWKCQWIERHRHPGSFWLHAVAIPMLPVAGILAGVQLVQGAWDEWWRPAVLVTLSYFLQALGHALEGNDMGEIILIKRLLGLPYVAVAPEASNAAQQEEHP